MEKKNRLLEKMAVFFCCCLIAVNMVNTVKAEEIKEPEESSFYSKACAMTDGDSNRLLYGKNETQKLSNASTTKILTCILAMENCSMDEVVTFSAKAAAQPKVHLGTKEGEQFYMRDLLYGLMLESYNDCAYAIAEHVGGSVEKFAEMMNEEALILGATNSHFINPHGLPDDNHYTTAYDMYLIMNAAVKYSLFNEIIQMDSYTTVYHDKNGAEKEVSVNNTNYYIQGTATAPGGITVIGGKTGTTNAAGHCLILLSRDTSSKPYISIIMRAEDKDALYGQMTDLLGEINN